MQVYIEQISQSDVYMNRNGTQGSQAFNSNLLSERLVSLSCPHRTHPNPSRPDGKYSRRASCSLTLVPLYIVGRPRGRTATSQHPHPATTLLPPVHQLHTAPEP